MDHLMVDHRADFLVAFRNRIEFIIIIGIPLSQNLVHFVPFFFVLDPGLIMQGEPLHILTVFGCAVLGVIVLSTSLQGYLYGVGDLTLMGLVQWPIRFGLMIGALAFAMPGNDVIGMNNMELFIAGIVFTGAAAILALTTKKVLAPG